MDETTASAGVEEISAEWVHMSEGTSVADYLGAIKPRLVVLPSDVPESERRMIVDVGLPVMILRL